MSQNMLSRMGRGGGQFKTQAGVMRGEDNSSFRQKHTHIPSR